MVIRDVAKVLLPIGLAGAGATGMWWLMKGGPNAGPRIVYYAFSAWVFVVLSALALLGLTKSRT